MPATTSRLRRHALAYAVLAALFVLTTTALVQSIDDGLSFLRYGDQAARPPFLFGDANWGAVNLEPEAEGAGLRFGDAILAVDARPVDGFFVYYGLLRHLRPGERLRVQARPPGEATAVKEVSIDLRPYWGRADAPDLSDHIAFGVRAIVLPVVCIALGFWVAVVRIRDRAAWLLLALLLSLTAIGSSGPVGMFGRDGFLQPLLAGFGAFRSQLLAPALLLFAVAFPKRLPLDRRFPWAKWIVAGYLLVVAAFVGVGVALWTHQLALARRLTEAPIQWLTGVEGDFGGAVSFVALLGAAIAFAWKAIAAPSRDAQRRLRLLFAGALPGLVALILALVATRLEYPLPGWSFLPLSIMILALPLTMAYVIVVHRAMDVRVVLRQGLQYVLARSGIRAVQIILLIAVSVVAASLLSGGAGLARISLVVAGIAAIAAISGRFGDRVRGWVDRRFFREAYEADAILSDLATRVRTLVETGPLLETVATRISESLHVARVAILLDVGGAFQPAYTLGYPATPEAAIPADSVTVQRLRKQQHALARFDDPDSWVQTASGVERRSLEALQPDLLLPLSLNEKVLGIMSLGPKKSEEAYSHTDLRLLDSVAVQTGLALENGRLTAAVAAEVAARAKQTRDIEIARDVQQRLFPQEIPEVPGLDCAGACRPALGVGGDYYDFIALPTGHLGLAIGDVSGKGIPAALLMATLRACLRGAQTIHHQSDLTVLMANLNRLVYDSSSANRYATFFYGEFDPSAGLLTYVNGGHNPPMIFRQGGGEVVRLDTGGPVIGLMDACDYAAGRVTLARGDVLVAFTDGVSEAMNAADDEWGEDRLADAVGGHRQASASEIIDGVMAAADAFVAGAPQHDDMTLIVVRLV